LFHYHDAATTAIYTLSLHDALPISFREQLRDARGPGAVAARSPGFQRSREAVLGRYSPHPGPVERQARAERDTEPAGCAPGARPDRKSTRLNSSHVKISYAVFCLKK